MWWRPSVGVSDVDAGLTAPGGRPSLDQNGLLVMIDAMIGEPMPVAMS
jgi:hypothetical protein